MFRPPQATSPRECVEQQTAVVSVQGGPAACPVGGYSPDLGSPSSICARSQLGPSPALPPPHQVHKAGFNTWELQPQPGAQLAQQQVRSWARQRPWLVVQPARRGERARRAALHPHSCGSLIVHTLWGWQATPAPLTHATLTRTRHPRCCLAPARLR
jgi:hypothetical protein